MTFSLRARIFPSGPQGKFGFRIDQGLVLLAITLLLLPSRSWAGFISMNPDLKAVIDESAKVVRVSGRVTNQGDESSREVSLEFPSLKRKVKVAEVMVVREPQEVNLEIPFSEIGIKKNGQYTLFYRIIYHDNNMYPFSNVQLIDLVLGTAPEKTLGMHFKLNGGTLLNVHNDADAELQLSSISDKEISIENVALVSPQEISAELEDSPPKTLQPGQNFELDFEVENKSALAGSAYYFAAVVSGLRGDVHFSETIATNIMIDKPIEKLRKTVMFGLALMGAVVAIGSTLSLKPLSLLRRKSSPPKKENPFQV